MSWWRKDKKPRRPRRESVERLEIPADVWEKCEACGHTDLREKFARNLNVCPACDYHRRIRAHEYASILLDEGSFKEVEADLRLAMRERKTLSLNDVLALAKSNQELRPVTIRLASEDIATARQLAVDKGIGYQTYIKLLLREALRKEAGRRSRIRGK